MKKTAAKTVSFVLLFFVIALALAHAREIRVTLGPVYRRGMKFEASGTSYSQLLGLQGALAYRKYPDTLSPINSADDLTQYADRSFEDGFVNVSRGTETFLAGRTWYWGYQNSSQYDAGNNTLAFERQYGSVARERYVQVTVDTLRDEAVSIKEYLSGWGLRVGADMVLRERDRSVVSVYSRIAAMPGIDLSCSTRTFEQEIKERRGVVEQGNTEAWEYTYDLTGIIPPAAPYEGATYEGPGVTIPNQPQDRTLTDSQDYQNARETSRDVYRAYNTIDVDYNMDMYSLQAGPRVGLKAAERLDIFVAGLVSLHVADVIAVRCESWSVDRRGTQTIVQSWRDEESDKFVRVGIGAEAGIDAQFGEQGFIRLSGGYDLVPDEMVMDVGPSEMSMNLSSWSAAAEIGFRW